MLTQFVSDVKDSARATARAAAFSALGTTFALIGLGFLTTALWMLLASHESALFAATVIGALYCAFGFGFLALGSRGTGDKRHRSSGTKRGMSDADAPPPRDPFLQLAEGFAIGLQAGRSARPGKT